MNDKNSVTKLCESLKESLWASDYRMKSLENLQSAQPPSFRHGTGIIIKPEIDLSEVSIASGASLTIKKESTESLEIIESAGFSELGKENHELFSASGGQSWTAGFNSAFSNASIFIRIPKGKKLGKTATFSITAEALPCSLSVFILAEDYSDALLSFSKHSSGSASGYFGINFHIAAREGARLGLLNVQDCGDKVSLFEERRATVQKDASVNWHDLSTGAAFASTAVEASLVEEGASSEAKCLMASRDGQKQDFYTCARHLAPNTKSDLLTKCVVSGKSKALSRGLILIGKDAHGSSGQERQEALVLSDEAEADAVPTLEINNYDVKCSHASSIGQIDEEKIFYLMNRGLSEDEARKLIIKGYFSPVLGLLGEAERAHLEEGLDKALSGQ